MVKSKFTFPLLILNLTLLVFILWLGTIFTTKIGYVPPDVFFFFFQLPIYYWIGLTILLCLIFWSTTFFEAKIFTIFRLLFVLLLVFYLFGTSAIVLENIRPLDAAMHLSWALEIRNSGTINTPGFEHVKNMPGAYIFFTELVVVTNIDLLSFMKIYPVMLMIGMVLVLFNMSQIMFGQRFAILAPTAFLGCAIFLEFHLCRQSFSYFLFAVLFSILLCKILFSKQIKPLFYVPIIVVLIAIMVSHPGTVIFLALALAVIPLTLMISLLPKRMRANSKKFVYRIAPLTIIFFIILGVGIGLSKPLMVDVHAAIQKGYESLSNPASISFGASNPSEDYGTIQTIRKVFIGFQILAVIGIIFLTERKEQHKSLILMAWFFSSLIFLIYPVLNRGHLIDRAFMFSLLPCSLLVPLFFSACKRSHNVRNYFVRFRFVAASLIATAMITLVILQPLPTHAGNAWEYTPSSTYHAMDFACARYTGGIMFMETHGGIISYYRATHPDTRAVFWTKTGVWSGGDSYPALNLDLNLARETKAILFIDNFASYFIIREGITEIYSDLKNFENVVAATHNLLYTNGPVRLYA